MKTAIMIDGAFYLRRAHALFGDRVPQERAKELENYCKKHIARAKNAELYRIFYYDCPPSEKVFWNPIEKKQVNLGVSEQFKWTKAFHEALTHKRKLALRLGEELEAQEGYMLKNQALKDLMNGKRTVNELTTRDLKLDIIQKGVDMKLGLDVASLAYGRYVDQIIMIAGDSDFVPAAKLARRHGIDFILDPMWQPISPSLNEHIDGLFTCCKKPKEFRNKK